MKKKIFNIVIFILFVLYFFLMNFFRNMDLDMLYIFGMSSSMAEGLIPYNDFNMVITPLYISILSFFLKFIANNTIVYHAAAAIVPATISFLVYKKNKYITPLFVILLSFISFPNYNTFALLLFFIVILLEYEKKNDYLIGFVLGLMFLTKINLAFFAVIPTAYYLFKDYKKCIKRFIGFLIPVVICAVICYFVGNLENLIDQCFFGIGEFAENNLVITPWIVIPIFLFIYFIIKFIKEKNVIFLYFACYQLTSYPIFTLTHIMFGFMPSWVYILYKLYNKKKKIFESAYIAFYILLISPFLGIVMVYKQKNFVKVEDNKYIKNRLEETYVLQAKDINSYFMGNYDNVYFAMMHSYFNKYLLNLKLDRYDLLLLGNTGKRGEKGVIEDFDSFKDSYFIITNEFQYNQNSRLIYDHIKNNYTLVKQLKYYQVYKNTTSNE